MRTLLKIGSGLLLLALVLIGLTFSVLRAQGVDTRGHTEGRELASEKRPVNAAVTDIELNGAIDMTLRQGALPSMTVRGERRLLGNIDTFQDGDKLQIGVKGMLLHKRLPLQVVLTLPSLETVRIRGSGESSINGFSGERIDVQLDGSASLKFNGRYRDVNAALRGTGELEMNGGASDTVDVTLFGTGALTVVGSCKRFKAEQNGPGSLDAEYLAAEAVTLALRGSGSSLVQASKSADVTVRGSGSVRVLGNPPERMVSRTGTGAVSFGE